MEWIGVGKDRRSLRSRLWLHAPVVQWRDDVRDRRRHVRDDYHHDYDQHDEHVPSKRQLRGAAAGLRVDVERGPERDERRLRAVSVLLRERRDGVGADVEHLHWL